jgi:hypothetical protein
MIKYKKISLKKVFDFAQRLKEKSKQEDREFIKKQHMSLIKAKKINVK